MTLDENFLYQQIVDLKNSHDKLYVIFEELDELIKSGYHCLSCEKDISGLLMSYEEYKKWKNINNKED